MKNYKFGFFLFAVLVTLSAIGCNDVRAAEPGLIKASGPSVYYAMPSGERYAFPNERTYFSWYTDFSQVRTVSDSNLASYQLRSNVTYRPGSRLVKITTDPKVYAVARGGILRWVQTEEVARALYGSNWARQVDDIPDTFFINYNVGTPISAATDFVPATELANTPTIQTDKTGASPTPTPTPTTGNYPGSLRTVNVNSEETMRDAMNYALPGDVIKIAAGTYTLGQQWWIEAHGTAANPIYVVAAGGHGSARITVPNDEGLNVGGGASYITFEDLEVFNTGNTVFHVQDGAHHITLRNLILHDAGPDGDVVKVNQANNVTIEGCDLYRPGMRAEGNEAVWQEALDIMDSNDTVARRNFLHDFGNMAGFVKGGSRRVLIENNVIDGQRVGAGDPSYGIGGWSDRELLGSDQYEAFDTTFRHNAILHGVNGALGLYDAYNSTIENNLFLNNDVTLIQPRAGNAPLETTSVVNVNTNKFVDTRGSMPTICNLHSHNLNGVTLNGNTYWNNGVTIPSGSECGVTPGTESGVQTSNPGISDTHPSTYDQAMQMLTRW